MFGRKNRKNKSQKESSRIIPVADMTSFVSPILTEEHKGITASDRQIIESLKEQLTRSGVIDKKEETFADDDQSIDDLLSIMSEANDVAKSEKDFNSTYYDEKADRFLDKTGTEVEDFDNPALDGVDDYGNQVYDDSRGFIIKQKNSVFGDFD